MRIKEAVLVGCAVFFTGSICIAADITSEPTENSATHLASVPAQLERQQMRSWIKSIEPAAGTPKTSIIVRKEYWQQTVNRKQPRHLRE